MLNIFKQFVEEFRQLAFWKKVLFLVMFLMVGGYPLVHAGIIKLPPAKAYDCLGVVNSQTLTVVMNDGKFDPASLAAAVCDHLVFRNDDSVLRWPAVGPHPTHSSYPGFDAGRGLHQGESFEFVLNRPGQYNFHDHLADEMVGTVIIEKPSSK
ncbi:MAG: hypothetical protein A3J07_03350 [Candidatus Doudnabacteria bacterium RIFCSPLOWO2_02_FULL_49_13]|uniref:EfeO-type cupredoxin-like domain-containing protein n=1 Tax=Candidatus Doudnabacteria bacterium RIFCSPHIGHO2_12_FULL_48_16 TaxID=1817838 RepID=A0A1F5PJ26_9BACT|nr:MAG: hypothetical protein A3B77_02155 [Candidatus Doudnabacteria bacterium RIFCSPHIGHO2_02_FULL_49_24]OGE89351.1 MAG: hypothetical protein A2760_03195 [Candidatus Doudnabacteria bacterium RIFCSPHIGHO2_01_FULL_50_67]OGE89958.1 MAG: hypothetical protein A3E29_02495 [Candidatus Doudnabacteria bacterium RIFCSPHIGHO2_12_FULL_48_16]OGE97497.1 MAG: hypothetical protein A2990_02140 [Candidatus Doudnabacteria bacterium RIFCSPLOWO2_01_FULL_49_40]OGF03099.1 MAG: hypothetical protein A3J07_03350 [Candid